MQIRVRKLQRPAAFESSVGNFLAEFQAELPQSEWIYCELDTDEVFVSGKTLEPFSGESGLSIQGKYTLITGTVSRIMEPGLAILLVRSGQFVFEYQGEIALKTNVCLKAKELRLHPTNI